MKVSVSLPLSFERLGIPLPSDISAPFRISKLNVYEVIPMKGKKFYPSITPPLAIFIAIMMLPGTLAASAPTEAVLHHFCTGTDAAPPYRPVISDPAGDRYGTTALGRTP